MSSERAGGLNRDWPGRAAALRSYGGELDQDMVDQLDRAHTPSERAKTPTHGQLDREAAVAAVQSYLAAPSWAHSPYLGVQASEIVALVLDGPSA